MTYQQTIDYLYAHLPMFSRVGAIAYKEDLHNTIALCAAIGNPQQHFKSIHIAGTNGKGSTSHMLAAILQEAGYKTALYTSPHLKDFRERIRVNGEMIEEQFVVDFVKRTKEISDRIQPSFFELTVAMAFEYFAEQQVDIAVIETGLGGRLDSTNIITPLLSVITNIGYDHMNILGDTLEKIAFEKAGIIKQGIPVVIGEVMEETRPVFLNKASTLQAPVYFAEEGFAITGIQSTLHSLEATVENKTAHTSTQYQLDLPGLYQAKNLRTVVCAISVLREQGFGVTEDAVHNALTRVKQMTGLHGRWEMINTNPVVILDVAHNEDGIKQVLQQVDNFLVTEKKAISSLHFVIGMVKDKEVQKVLSLLPPGANYYFTQATIPRALDAITLKQMASTYHLQGEVFENVNDAIKAARQHAAADDLVIVCGSVFLVGEVDSEGC
jgi:dihydrofolate synthase/folylpolyglutamate synthase